MGVLCLHALIIINTGRKAEVGTFTPDYKTLQKVPIVDAAISYTCPYNDKLYILIFKNLLSVPSMKKYIIPPFVIREVRLHVNTIPKIHTIG